MENTILLGVASAALYGITDFVGRFANRSSGVLRTMLWGQGFLSVCLTLAVLVTRAAPHGNRIDGLLLMISSLAVVAGTGCLYCGLAIGRLTIVSPIMATYGAISALLSIATGEPMTLGVGTGLACAVTGAVLSATSGEKTAKGGKTGWLPASGSALLYGFGFWLQGKYSIPRFGALTTLWIYYLTATAMVGIVCLIRRQSVRPGDLRDITLILATAVLAGGGYGALVAAQATGSIAVATALSAASTAVTVMLAYLFLRNKPDFRGWLGVAGVVIGVALIHLSSANP